MKITSLSLTLTILILISSLANAATVTISTTTPTTDGEDIANMAASTGDSKVWSDAVNIGQSFSTGSNAGGYELSSFSIQLRSDGTTSSARNFNFRVIDLSGGDSSTSTLISETASTSDAWVQGDWISFSFTSPVSLSANTLYGVDLEHTGGGNWSNGIYYTYFSGNDYGGGDYYTRADGDPSAVSYTTGRDQLFHVDMVAAVPEVSTFAFLATVMGSMMLIRRKHR